MTLLLHVTSFPKTPSLRTTRNLLSMQFWSDHPSRWTGCIKCHYFSRDAETKCLYCQTKSCFVFPCFWNNVNKHLFYSKNNKKDKLLVENMLNHCFRSLHRQSVILFISYSTFQWSIRIKAPVTTLKIVLLLISHLHTSFHLIVYKRWLITSLLIT